jgi:hypothetical protein
MRGTDNGMYNGTHFFKQPVQLECALFARAVGLQQESWRFEGD